ncbi:MAG: hypothetical protein P8101_08880, partial [Candidatus Thiodiazotropha sp.]
AGAHLQYAGIDPGGRLEHPSIAHATSTPFCHLPQCNHSTTQGQTCEPGQSSQGLEYANQ